jgi:hypothetical protein
VTAHHPGVALVETLADALDADDFVTVRDLLAADCTYLIEGERHEGPDAVVSSYRAGSQLARRLFDDVEFRHTSFAGPTANELRVRYEDRLRAGDEVLVHVTEQDVTVDPSRGVTRIVDRPVPGEHARLEAFMARHGIVRPR